MKKHFHIFTNEPSGGNRTDPSGRTYYGATALRSRENGAIALANAQRHEYFLDGIIDECTDPKCRAALESA